MGETDAAHALKEGLSWRGARLLVYRGTFATPEDPTVGLGIWVLGGFTGGRGGGVEEHRRGARSERRCLSAQGYLAHQKLHPP